MTAISARSFPKVGRELQIRGKLLRSRVYLPGHQPGLADEGLPGERYIAYHRLRARAGLGMQITGATPARPPAARVPLKASPRPRRPASTRGARLQSIPPRSSASRMKVLAPSRSPRCWVFGRASV